MPRRARWRVPKRACPECGSVNYSFRNRKQIEATAESPAGVGDEVPVQGLRGGVEGAGAGRAAESAPPM